MGRLAKDYESHLLAVGPIHLSHDLRTYVHAMRWCCEETEGLFASNVNTIEKTVVTEFFFEKETDALLFKLSWGGL